MFIQKYYPVAEIIISRKHRRCDTTTTLIREIPEPFLLTSALYDLQTF